MRFLRAASALLLLAVPPCYLLSQSTTTSKPSTRANAKKKKKKKRSVPKPPPVSAAARAHASEDVTDMLDRTAGIPIENPAAMVPFFVLTFFTGPVAGALGGVDISFVIGLVVSGGLYFGLTRTLDLAAEQPAIDASERELATVSA